jgi:drug/metabolite transporter (DMT)-like permease
MQKRLSPSAQKRLAVGWPALRRVLAQQGLVVPLQVAVTKLALHDAVAISLVRVPMTAVLVMLPPLKEALSLKAFVGCLVCLSGVVLVVKPPFLFGGAPPVWIGVLMCFITDLLISGGCIVSQGRPAHLRAWAWVWAWAPLPPGIPCSRRLQPASNVDMPQALHRRDGGSLTASGCCPLISAQFPTT